MPKVKVKWGAKEFSIDVILEETPLLLKAQLFELTNVPPDRQKLIIKGKTIPDESWNGIKIQDGTVIMLIGSAEALTIQSTKPTDTTEAGIVAGKGRKLPVGLRNLGNTCYMNSSLQCFKAIPEIEAVLRKYNPDQAQSVSGAPDRQIKLFTNSLKSLYNEMNRVSLAQGDEDLDVIPFAFVHVLRQTFPQFNTQDNRGNHQQQDANECFCELLRTISEEKVDKSEDTLHDGKVPLKKYFEIGFDVSLKCMDEESKDEPQKSKETILQLSCFLDQEVRYIHSGIKNKMLEEIEKKSESLGRDAKFQKQTFINRLPCYLSIQMVRFFYKEDKKLSAKILKDVKFPIVLDVFDLCSPELQSKLMPARAAIKEFDETKIELMRKAKLAVDGETTIDLKSKECLPTSFPDDIGSNNSGFYELKGLITHQGRSSTSGHYVAWVRVGDDEEDNEQAKWAVCDDNNIAPVSEEEILKLSGGGDWHCAYVLLYGPKKTPKLDKPKDE